MTSVSSVAKKGRKSRARVRRRPAKEESVLRWVRVARRRGMKGRELVHELHVRRGFGLPKVARLLRVSLKMVRRYWRQHVAERAGAAKGTRRPRMVPPLEVRSEEDVVAMREQVCVALWETVVETFAEVKPGAGKASEMVGEAVSPPMMTVRMRALKQMGRLYGVGGRRRSGAKKDVEPGACATPGEIAELVRKREREAGRTLSRGSEDAMSQPGRRCGAIA